MREGSIGLLCIVSFVCALPAASPVSAEDTYWHVMGIHPKGYWLEVKAVDENGKMYDINAIQQDDNVHMLDVKAIVDGERHPVKIVESNDIYAPVKAINIDNENLDLVAITPEGKLLDVKGVRRTGSIIHIKVVGVGGRYFPVKAISPEGRLYDIKGIKMTTDRVETLIGGTKIHAHVKALPPAGPI